MAGPWPKVLFAERTDPGRDPEKRENEDASFYAETRLGHLLVLCDGMGGHASGREASNAAIRTIHDLVARAANAADPGEVLRAAIAAAGRTVYGLGGTTTDPARPGSTCVAMLIHPLGTEIAHVGDSRGYVVRGGKVWPLTRDHSMVRELVDAGLLRPEAAANHPEANKITRALGISPEVEVELRPDAIVQENGDLFFLTSDGVTDVIPDADLEQLALQALATRDTRLFCDRVVDLANSRGGPDNITVQAALVLDAGLDPGARTRPPRVVPVTDVGDRVTPTGTPSFSRMPASPQGGQPNVGPRGTMRLAVHSPPAPPPSMRMAPALVAAETPRPPATILDDGTIDDPYDVPPSAVLVAAPPSRARRVVVGLALAVAGAAVFSVSLSRLLFDDEAPPPMVEAPSGSTAPSGSSSAAPAPR
jgi:serine/threonine protein phosphatase PrpC